MSAYALYKTTYVGHQAEDLGMAQFHKAELKQDQFDNDILKEIMRINATLGK